MNVIKVTWVDELPSLYSYSQSLSLNTQFSGGETLAK